MLILSDILKYLNILQVPTAGSALLGVNNLSDVVDAAVARANLGLGSTVEIVNTSGLVVVLEGRRYVCTASGVVNFSLTAALDVGAQFSIVGSGVSLQWSVSTQDSLESILLQEFSTSAGGSVASTSGFDCCSFVKQDLNNWRAYLPQGQISIT